MIDTLRTGVVNKIISSVAAENKQVSINVCSHCIPWYPPPSVTPVKSKRTASVDYQIRLHLSITPLTATPHESAHPSRNQPALDKDAVADNRELFFSRNCALMINGDFGSKC